MCGAGGVRQVDRKPGVAAGRVLADFMGLDESHLLPWPVFGEPPRRGEPGKARAHNHPIGALGARERRPRDARREDAAPAVGGIVAREKRYRSHDRLRSVVGLPACLLGMVVDDALQQRSKVGEGRSGHSENLTCLIPKPHAHGLREPGLLLEGLSLLV